MSSRKRGAFGIIVLILSFVSFSVIAQSTQKENLRKQILAKIADAPATVGVAIMDWQGDTLLVNDRLYPMQSVYKLPLAMAVVSEIEEGQLGFNDNVTLRKADLLPDIYSPLAEKFPNGTNVKLHDVLHYAVSLSDNNACDVLFRLMGGPKKVHQFVSKKLGIDGVNIKNTEEELHANPSLQFDNSCKPSSAIRLLSVLQKSREESTNKFLWKQLLETPTGPSRIKGLLPASTVVAHKTGTGGEFYGSISAINDIGVIQLPDGKQVSVAIFVTNFRGDLDKAELLIAQIAKAVYNHFSVENP